MSRFFAILLAVLTVTVSANADTLTIKTDSLDKWTASFLGTEWDLGNVSSLLADATTPTKSLEIKNGNQYWTNGNVPVGTKDEQFGLYMHDVPKGYYAYSYSLASLLPENVSDVSFSSGWVNPDDGLRAIMLRGADGTLETLWNGSSDSRWAQFLTDADSELTSLSDLIFVAYENAGGFYATLTLLGATLNYTAASGGDGAATPEPATLALFGMGLAGLALARRRRK